MTKIKTIQTNKLFYGSWPYKVVCRMHNPFKLKNLYQASRWSVELIDNYEYAEANKIYKILDSITATDVKLRFEYRSLSIFCKKPGIYARLKRSLDYCIREVHEPNSNQELEYMIEHGKKHRIVDKFPQGKFLYRIYIKPSMPLSARENFYAWLQKYPTSIIPSRTTVLWLTGENFYSQAPFVYVENEGILAFAGMFLGDHIKLTEKFILRSSINNENKNEESTCQHSVKD